MTNTDLGLTLVTAGTGKTGRRVAERLAARGVAVRLGSRGAEPPFDWTDPATWPAALAGVDAAYLAYHPDLAFPGATERIAELAGEAARSGVRRIVLLSGRGEPAAQAAELAVAAAGTEWAVVRASFFAQNFSEGEMADAVRSGVLAFPGGSVAEPFVDVDDLADVAVAALTAPVSPERVFEITGPRLLDFAQVAAELSDAAGYEVRYQPISTEEFAESMIAGGAPSGYANDLAELFGDLLDGRNAMTADGVSQALGRPPRDFREFARAAAADGAWQG